MLKRRLARERAARREAERLLEVKALALYEANQQLQHLNENLEQQIRAKLEEQRANELHHRQLIESVQDLIFKVSPAGRFTFVSSAAEKMLGYSEAECIGMRATDLVQLSHRQAMVEYYTDMIAQQRESSYDEFPITTKDGRTIWIGQSVRLVAEAGQVVEMVAVARDITDRKLAEVVLKTTQVRLSTLITSLQSGVLVVDEQGRILLINQLFCDIFSLDLQPDQLTGQDSGTLSEASMRAVENPEDFLVQTRFLLSQRQTSVGEVINLKNGRILERDYIPLFLNEQYLGHLWQYTDVTEKHTAREQIRRSEEKYRGIMNNMELGLLEVNNEQIVVRVYERCCQMLGYREDELLGQHLSDLLVPKEFREVIDRQQQQRLRGVGGSYELQLLKKDGSRIWVLVSGVPIYDEESRLVGSMAIYYDLTERKLLETELANAKQVAEDARQAEKQFLANMSHEIRTPLNAIIGMSHLLFDTQPTSQQREYIDILKTSADFLHGLISNLLDMTKIEAGRVEVNPRPFDLAGLLRSTQKVFEMKLQDRPIQFHIMLDARISGNFMGDEVMLNQILTNLVGNAEKFTEVGSIQLTVRIRHEDANNIWVEFAVADTGIGIPAEKIGLVFQKFKQVNPQGHKHKGTGLGLAITKELVDLLGGTINVESRAGHGSTFTFVLPFPKIMAPLNANLIDTPPPASVKPEVGHVLVVEDNLMNQKYIGSLLRKWQVRYTLASDGRQAVMEARRQRFDLILMDIQMPVMNGYEATVAIRNTHNPNQHAPIVALTASAMLDHKNVALEAGMTDFLTKPFDPGQLMLLLRQYPHSEPGEQGGFQLDRNRLTELYGDDRIAAAEMFNTFLISIVPDLLQLPGLCRQQNWPELVRQAHKLKPTLGMVGLTRLENTMHRLEKASRHAADPDLVNVYCQEVVTALQEAIPLLEDEVQLLNET